MTRTAAVILLSADFLSSVGPRRSEVILAISVLILAVGLVGAGV